MSKLMEEAPKLKLLNIRPPKKASDRVTGEASSAKPAQPAKRPAEQRVVGDAPATKKKKVTGDDQAPGTRRATSSAAQTSGIPPKVPGSSAIPAVSTSASDSPLAQAGGVVHKEAGKTSARPSGSGSLPIPQLFRTPLIPPIPTFDVAEGTSVADLRATPVPGEYNWDDHGLYFPLVKAIAETIGPAETKTIWERSYGEAAHAGFQDSVRVRLAH